MQAHLFSFAGRCVVVRLYQLSLLCASGNNEGVEGESITSESINTTADMPSSG